MAISLFTKTYFESLFAYHWHTNFRLLNCASQLSDPEISMDPDYGRGSIFNLFFHILRSDNTWRFVLETGRPLSPLRVEDYPDLKAVESGLGNEQNKWQSLLDRLSPVEIESSMETDRRGETVLIARWRILQHVILHGMQHHTELAQILTQKGQSPGNIDFIFFG
jgi:uncharacterized damage-inducible protein DinB